MCLGFNFVISAFICILLCEVIIKMCPSSSPQHLKLSFIQDLRF